MMTTDRELKEQLADTIAELYRAGVVTASGGNLSVRSVEREDAAWITPSRRFKGGLRPEHMILIDLRGQKLEGVGDPSVEVDYHAAILRLRSEVNAVVHSHAPLATMFGMCDLTMPPILPEAVLIAHFPTIPFHLGGTKDLAEAVIDALGHGRANGAYLRNHGLITLGKDLRQAADTTYLVEHTIKILLLCRLADREPSQLPPAAVDSLLHHAGVT